MYCGVPIVAAIEDRLQLARRPHIQIRRLDFIEFCVGVGHGVIARSQDESYSGRANVLYSEWLEKACGHLLRCTVCLRSGPAAEC